MGNDINGPRDNGLDAEVQGPQWNRDGELTVCFGKPKHGWIAMVLLHNGGVQHHVSSCSDVYDPFRDLVAWLEAVANDSFPAVVEINEEGSFTVLTVDRSDAGWVEFLAEWVLPFGRGPAATPEPGWSGNRKRVISGRVPKYQLLAKFHRRIVDFIAQDFQLRHWQGSFWWDYEHDEEPYCRRGDLRRLNHHAIEKWLEGNQPMTMKIERIVSGGQTGADRAALDWAIERGIPHGGWCPAGRLAEDGTVPVRYNLEEMPDGGGYRRRTKANVRDSDATLVVSIEPVLSGGSKETVLFARRLAKPWLHVHPQMDWRAALVAWLESAAIETLNVAGPRASREPEVAAFTWKVLDELRAVLGKLPGEQIGQ
jgi:hypothetical protein